MTSVAPSTAGAAWLSLKEAAVYTGASTDTLRRRIREGQLRAYYFGRSHMIRLKAADLDALMKPVPTLATMGGAR